MTDFIHNLVLRGSGSIPVRGQVQPAYLPQFPPRLTLNAWQNPLSFPAPTVPPEAAASPEAGSAPPPGNAGEAEPAAPSSPADNAPLTRQIASPAASPDHLTGRSTLPQRPSPASLSPVPPSKGHPAPASQEASPLPVVQPVESQPPSSPPKAGRSSPAVQSIEPAETSRVESASPGLDRPRRLHPSPEDGALPAESGEPPAKVTPPARAEVRAAAISGTTTTIRGVELPVVQPHLPASPQIAPESGPGGPPTRYLARELRLPSTASQTTASPPTVEVHIGTVEVRANQPPPAPPPSLTPRPQGFDGYAYLRGWDGE